MQDRKTKLLYIAGTTRTGSTLLDRTLGSVDGFVSVGELLNAVWKRGQLDREPCGCGARVKECDFWRAVFRVAYGGSDAVRETDALPSGVAWGSTKDALRLISPWKTAHSARRLGRETELLEHLYTAIADVSRCRVIVDSSKHPIYMFKLGAVQSIDLYAIRVIRDSRAVAYSWSKSKPKYTIDGKTAYLKTKTPFTSAMHWIHTHLVFEMLARAGIKAISIRYEDFAAHPRETLSAIGAFTQEDLSKIPFVSDNAVELADRHIASGNPMRFRKGSIEIRPDFEWRTKMVARDKLLVTALTWPLLLRYGYLTR